MKNVNVERMWEPRIHKISVLSLAYISWLFFRTDIFWAQRNQIIKLVSIVFGDRWTKPGPIVAGLISVIIF